MSREYHEPYTELSTEAQDIHRALTSLIEELEAVDWYHQRADVTTDESLRAVLLHNRDEEIEHASMALEWIRRRIPKFDAELRTYLFTSAPITEIEGGGESGEGAAGTDTAGGSLGIGNMK
ncbi:MAG: ferritin-like domain-containing protein [bacterium]